MPSNEELVIALPKGRILKEVMPLIRAVGIEPEPAFDDPSSRLLQFRTNHPNISIIRVRSFDVATFVAFGAAQLGVAGNDVLLEFDYPEIYAPVDLDIGHCHIAVAQPRDLEDENSRYYVAADHQPGCSQNPVSGIKRLDREVPGGGKCRLS